MSGREIRYTEDCIRDVLNAVLREDTTVVLFRLVQWSAIHMTDGFYSSRVADPDGHIDLDDERMFRVVWIGKKKWKRIRSEIDKFFEKTDKGYRLLKRDEWITIRGSASKRAGNDRPSLSPAMRMFIGNRDGWTCGYCGTKDGPFDIDHIVPLSRGGAPNDTENLICACARCNRSKGDKAVEEWVSS